MATYCTNCGAQINETFKFCASCGASVNTQIMDQEDESVHSSNFVEKVDVETANLPERYTISIGKLDNRREIVIGAGTGAKLLFNGDSAVDILNKEGYTLTKTNMNAILTGQFGDLLNEKCEVLPPDVIAKLYKVYRFLDIIGCKIRWKEIPLLIGGGYKDIVQEEDSRLARQLFNKKLNMDLPYNDDASIVGERTVSIKNQISIIRRGEALVLKGKKEEAIDWYRQLIESQGDNTGFAYNVLGGLCEDRNEKEAWLKKAAEHNNILGLIQLGRLYESGTDNNIVETLRYYLRAYKQENQYATETLNEFLHDHLIEIYENGCRIENVSDYDYKELADRCEREAECGKTNAALTIGYIYQYGLGRQKSLIKARDYYKRCIDESIRKSDAYKFLGDIYYEGSDAIPQNMKTAVEYWEKSAKTGRNNENRLGLFSLGQAFEYGWGDEEDKATAIKYYKESGNAKAWNALGVICQRDKYLMGDTRLVFDQFLANDDAAYKCFKKSAELGSTDGMRNYALIHLIGRAGNSWKKEPEKTAQYLPRAAELGDTEALFNLGEIYESGMGCEANRFEAVKCFQQAAKGGSDDAAKKVKALGGSVSASGGSSEDAYGKLQKLIGLEGVKKEVEEVINEAKIIKEMRDKGLPDSRGAYHMVFTGNPGTGKTEVARLIGAIFKEYGILSQGQLIEVDRSKLVASYIGQTAGRTQEVIEMALGGVLFIDEAYTLHKESENDFGQEAIDTILKEMEDHRDDLLVIVAGYEKPMYDFIHSNSGLESRFRRTIHFDDYNADELMQIFKKFCDDNGNIMDEAVEKKVFQGIKKIVSFKTDNFGNAREIRKIYEDTIRKQRNRLSKDNSEHTKEELLTIIAEDLPENMVDAEVDIDILMSELDALIGLDEVKEEIRDLADLIEIQSDRRDMGIDSSLPSLHMVFTGNPGTGKTTVARLVAKIYHALGVLSKGTLIETSRADLVAGYSGQTAIKTKDITDRAIGGVLFIDEAYTLVQGEDDAFGQEAIDTLLKEMEDHRNNLAVIVAGYTDEMQDFISANSGLASRFNRYIEFSDYSVDQLISIFTSRCKSEHYTLTDGFVSSLRDYLESIDRSRFGNGRGIRNLFEKILPQQAKRLLADKKSGKALSKEDYQMITEKDLEKVLG